MGCRRQRGWGHCPGLIPPAALSWLQHDIKRWVAFDFCIGQRVPERAVLDQRVHIARRGMGPCIALGGQRVIVRCTGVDPWTVFFVDGDDCVGGCTRALLVLVLVLAMVGGIKVLR